MAWTEPLTVTGTHIGNDATIQVRDAGGVLVADANAKGYRAEHFGIMGDVNVYANAGAGGAPAQRIRAVVLIIREVSRLAAAAGITTVHVEVRSSTLRVLVARILGRTGDVLVSGGAIYHHDLPTLRAAILTNSDARGNG